MVNKDTRPQAMIIRVDQAKILLSVALERTKTISKQAQRQLTQPQTLVRSVHVCVPQARGQHQRRTH